MARPSWSKEGKAAIIGSGSFGTALSILIAQNTDVLLYTRSQKIADAINSTGKNNGHELSDRITATTDIEQVCSECQVIFPVVPSRYMRDTIRAFAPYLYPTHILIHATKGFDLTGVEEENLLDEDISRSQIRTMSEVITQESSVVRVGCLSGPNLAKEIMEGQPTATVIASEYDEVIELGRSYLAGARFYVFGTHDIIAAEMAGALKNIIAIGSGMLTGLGLGKNIQGMLITRGLNEMIHLGKAMGAGYKAFLGTAGIGDLVTTATSPDSRNFQTGHRLSQGESLEQVITSSTELAEGLRTMKIVHQLINHYRLKLPVMELLYRVTFEGVDLLKGIEILMRYPFATDVDFLT